MSKRGPAKHTNTRKQKFATRNAKNAKTKGAPWDLASMVRGLYGRVAKRLGVDPSYVSRVARDERNSKEIEVALRKELDRIVRQYSQRHG